MSGSKPTEQNFCSLSTSWVKKYYLTGISKQQKYGRTQWSWNGHVRCSIGYEINTMSYPGWLRVYYANTNGDKCYDYKIYFTVTCPHYGGERLWFLCPVQGCGKRVAVLYLGKIFACRHCQNMVYSCQNEDRGQRLLSKAQKIHRQLGGDWAVDSSPPPKPKGMHWKTYRRKVVEMEAADNYSMEILFNKIGMQL